MRKIVSKQEEDRRKKKNQIIAGGVLIAVMIFSVLGYAFQNVLTGNSVNSGNVTQTITYNGINFQQTQSGYWTVGAQGSNQLVFTYNPTEIPLYNLTNLTMNINDFKGKPLYIDSNGNLNAESEIYFNMKNFASSIADACPEGETCNSTSGQILPTKSGQNNFIIIQQGNGSVSQEGNCIYISGNSDNLISLIDNVLFKILGITS